MGEHFLYALHKIIEAKKLMIQSEHKEDGGQQIPKRKHKLFSLKTSADQDSKEQDVEKQEVTVDRKLMKALEKISVEDTAQLETIYAEFTGWLEKEGRAGVDNKKIDDKQRTLEMKVGDHVTSLITESYNISRSCRSLY